MEKIFEYAKGIAASVGSVLTAIIVGLPAIGVEVPQWLAIVTLIATSVAVVAIPNRVSAQQAADIIDHAVLDPEIPVTYTDY